jgi:hypothetical protein
MAVALPIIGDWYQKPGRELFEVVAVDEQDGTIEIQYFDGTVEEVEFEAWSEGRFTQAEAPEDYSGSLDMDAEDAEREIERTPHREWSDPLEFLDQAE